MSLSVAFSEPKVTCVDNFTCDVFVFTHRMSVALSYTHAFKQIICQSICLSTIFTSTISAQAIKNLQHDTLYSDSRLIQQTVE